MSITLQDIRDAATRIEPYIEHTPTVRLRALDDALGCQVYAKLENLQVTNSFKIRGALNMALQIPASELANGIVAASSGNHGRAVAYAAQLLGTRATIVMPDTAAPIKIEGIRALGAEVVLCDAAERFEVAARVCAEQNAAMIPPFDHEKIMAGQATVGLEIIEQLPDVDVVMTPVSGGGLIGGVASACKLLKPSTHVFGAEPAALPRYSESLAAGERVTVPKARSIADALVALTPGEACFPVIQQFVDAVFPVPDEAIAQARDLLLSQGKLLAEPSSCITMAAILSGAVSFTPDTKVCFVISGGNVEPPRWA